ncbi:MAG TPA: tetratricopeptide repeat protein [Verrucomicrobiae bacterium]|nr:tetratricopeptide repeat protein [Verrucomicrobiae bacterium]
MHEKDSESKSKPVRWMIAGGLLLIMAVALLLPRKGNYSVSRRDGWSVVVENYNPAANAPGGKPINSATKPGATPEDIVAGKVTQFARSRREIAFGLARKHQVEISAEVERFFDAVEAGNWDEVETLFTSIMAKHQGEPSVKEVDEVWPAVLDAYGAAQQAHEWPAQKLLDYGNAIMATLKPNTVYVGGTDSGRWVPALMNTSDNEGHIVITQNGLADQKYAEYVQFLYGDRFAALTPEDTIAAEKAYLQDARKRLEHDQQFPNEPKQLRPGEDIQLSKDHLEHGFADGEVQARGQVAVMGVNELLLNQLLKQNPNLSFVLEESFPLGSTHADATPLGPILQLRASEENVLTKDRAAQTVDYWRQETDRLMADPEFLNSEHAKKSYSKLILSQGGLLQERNFPAEAEDAFRFANQLCPYNPEVVFRYVDLLARQQRFDEAIRVTDTAISADPNFKQFREVRSDLARMKQQ